MHIERDLTQEWNSAPFGLPPRAAVAEDRCDTVAGGAAVARHVFDQIPSSGMFTFWNIAMARRASINARSCGVETIIAPVSGACWAM